MKARLAALEVLKLDIRVKYELSTVDLLIGLFKLLPNVLSIYLEGPEQDVMNFDGLAAALSAQLDKMTGLSLSKYRAIKVGTISQRLPKISVLDVTDVNPTELYGYKDQIEHFCIRIFEGFKPGDNYHQGYRNCIEANPKLSHLDIVTNSKERFRYFMIYIIHNGLVAKPDKQEIKLLAPRSKRRVFSYHVTRKNGKFDRLMIIEQMAAVDRCEALGFQYMENYDLHVFIHTKSDVGKLMRFFRRSRMPKRLILTLKKDSAIWRSVMNRLNDYMSLLPAFLIQESDNGSMVEKYRMDDHSPRLVSHFKTGRRLSKYFRDIGMVEGKITASKTDGLSDHFNNLIKMKYATHLIFDDAAGTLLVMVLAEFPKNDNQRPPIWVGVEEITARIRVVGQESHLTKLIESGKFPSLNHVGFILDDPTYTETVRNWFLNMAFWIVPKRKNPLMVEAVREDIPKGPIIPTGPIGPD